MPLSDAEQQYMSVFHPHALGEISRFEVSGRPFVYYTQASTAVKIIKNREFWMRRASLMNDFSETQHGLECIEAVYNAPEGLRFRALIDGIHPGVSAQAKSVLDQSAEVLLGATYLTSISEHGHPEGKKIHGQDEEDANGRLSMWRGYGGAEGVALVLNPKPILSGPGIDGVFFSPVGYFRDTGFAAELSKVSNAIEKNTTAVKEYGSGPTLNAIVNMFRFAAICAKHPGFREEREWRVVCSDAIATPSLTQTQELIGTVSQPILHIPIAAATTVANLILRVIVGPTKDPDAIRGQLVAALTEANVPKPDERVVKSDIPWRNWQQE